jgi:hypothetical protein
VRPSRRHPISAWSDRRRCASPDPMDSYGFPGLGLGLDVEVSVVGADRHEEVMQEALQPG